MPRADPRIRKVLTTVNGQVADRAIRHALFLERFKTHEVDQIIRFLNSEVFPDIANIVRVRLEMGRVLTWTAYRHQEMLKAVDQEIRTGMRYARNRLSKELKAFAISEAEFQAAVMDGYTPKVFGIDFVVPPPAKLHALVTSKPFEGKLLREWFDGLVPQHKAKLGRAIKVGMAQGEPIPKIMRRIRGSKAAGFKDGIFEISRRNCEAIVRTATAHVASAARMATYEANKDVVAGWKFLATLDAMTTDICMSLDGNEYVIGEGGADRPPLHFQCRSTTTPILKSWKELGIDLKEAPPGTRATMDGQVPANLTYGEWLKGQPDWVQNSALGKGKAEIFRRGDLSIKQFVDNRNQPLTLKQLIELEKAQ